MKQCIKCGEWKEIDAFHIRRDSKDGRRNECRQCQSKRQNKWMLEHWIDKLKAYRHKRSVKIAAEKRANRLPKPKPMTRKEIRRRHYEKHRDKIIADTTKWWREHKDHLRECARKNYAKHPQKDIARGNKRRATIQNAGTFTQNEWDALCARYDNRCLRCGSDGPLTVDHVIPLCLGGKNTIDNIQPLCLRCNSSKGTKHIDYR